MCLLARSKRGMAVTYREFTTTAWRDVMMSLLLAEIYPVVLIAITDFSVTFLLASLLLSSLLDPFVISLYDYLAVDSDLYYKILAANVLRIPSTDVSPSRMTPLVRNNGRMTAFGALQSRSFFELERSLTAARRRTSVVGRWIFLQNW